MASSQSTLYRPTSAIRPDLVPSPKTALAWGAIAAFVALGVWVAAWQGWNKGFLYMIGFLCGVALYHARFGFTSAFRQLLSVGQTEGLRAHLLMLAAASILFALIFTVGTTVTGDVPKPSVNPIGVSLVVGAIIFGVGMQLGGGCASGTLYHIGGGQSSAVLTLAGFVLGSVIGAWHWDFWINDLPSYPAISLAETTGWGYGIALIVQLLILGLLYVLAVWISRKKNPPMRKPVPTDRGWKRIVRGAWPLWVGALVLATLNGLTLFVAGRPWGITSAFALWGSKIALALGIDVTEWAYWAGERANPLYEPVLGDITSLMDIGIILGAFFAATIGGTFKLSRPSLKVILASLIGGILMGYGARLSYGCNIGAYFAGIASFSLHGYAWGVFALAGSYIGIKLRPLFGLRNPKPTDSVC